MSPQNMAKWLNPQATLQSSLCLFNSLISNHIVSFIVFWNIWVGFHTSTSYFYHVNILHKLLCGIAFCCLLKRYTLVCIVNSRFDFYFKWNCSLKIVNRGPIFLEKEHTNMASVIFALPLDIGSWDVDI